MDAPIDTRDDPGAWKRRAACGGLDPDMFHSMDRQIIAEAKSVCAQCPVVQECLEYELPFDRSNAFSDWLGVYGGLTANERRLFWRRMQRSTQQSWIARSASA
jgi:WhiB family redox-sensing transcriptional regulator